MERPLTNAEKSLANAVFGTSINCLNVAVADDLGFAATPYTMPDALNWSRYVLHMGPLGYEDCTQTTAAPWYALDRIRDVFIHELVHVWQGVHSFFPFNFACNSFWDRALWETYISNEDPYHVSTQNLKPWSGYLTEQQGMVVQLWFRDWDELGRPNMDTYSSAFRRLAPTGPLTRGVTAGQLMTMTRSTPSSSRPAVIFWPYVRDHIRKGVI